MPGSTKKLPQSGINRVLSIKWLTSRGEVSFALNSLYSVLASRGWFRVLTLVVGLGLRSQTHFMPVLSFNDWKTSLCGIMMPNH